MQLADLKNKRIGILGFGIEGQAVANYLQASGVAFEILDQNPELDLGTFKTAPSYLGPDYLQHIQGFEVLFRSPGIRFFPELVAARNKGCTVTSQIKFFFDNCPAKIIAVSGTKGKGTTCTLLYEMLKQAGMPVYLGGNVGTGVLDLLGQLQPTDWVILELSSFQLQDLEKSPHIAVVLMVTSEHLDYHLSREEYVLAKTSLTRYQKSGDFAIINWDYEGSRHIGELGAARKYYVHTLPEVPADFKDGIVAEQKSGKISFISAGRASEFLNAGEVQLAGYHNIQNICAASLAAKIVGVDPELIKKVAQEFPGYEHRLEYVCERGGIKFYNDSSGSTPESCIAAVRAFDAPEIAVIGGFDKEGDYPALARELARQENLKAAILIGQIASKVELSLRANNFRGKILTGAKDLTEVFGQIRGIAEKGDIVLLAPATSSFDWFKNYRERGDLFKKLAREF